MRSAPHLFNEDERLAALAEYDLQNPATPIDLQEIVDLTARLFDVPIVLVSIVEREHQKFQARVGLDVCETARDISFCAHALGLERHDILVVPDAKLDLRFATNPLVTGEPGIRFYAGVPLRSPTDHAIGTLCIIDKRPWSGFSERERDDLRALGALVVDKLEMRRLAVARAAGQSRFENIAATSPDGIICADQQGRITFWNSAAETLFGFATREALGASIDIIVPERMRGGHGGGLQRVAAGGTPRLVGTTVELPAARSSGEEFPIELSLSMWHENDAASFGAIIRDITERRANEERLFRLAHLDSLTGLPNRTVLLDRIADHAKTQEPASLLMIDLDGFKDVNDTLGHTAGDTVLKQIAGRLLHCARPIDTVARLGGDEFAILMPDSLDSDAVGSEADCLIAILGEALTVKGQQVYVTASVGIAMFPRDGAHAEDLLSAADLAMYQAKEEGRDCRRFFSPELREKVVGRRAFEGEIRRAIDENEFQLFYQPQVSVESGVTVGVEALLRWRHPKHGLLAPDRFMKAIENGPFAAEVGRWVLRKACQDAVQLRRTASELMMGVNLFGAQFRTGRIAEEVRNALNESGLPAFALELEITENIILRHDEQMLQPLRELRALGVGIAFDDFGTGYASLSMLKRYPLSRIKIDRSFVNDICEDHADAAIVQALVQLAQGLGIEVIAEGVETEPQRDAVSACGCRTIQGYLFGRPMPIDQLRRRLRGIETAVA